MLSRNYTYCQKDEFVRYLRSLTNMRWSGLVYDLVQLRVWAWKKLGPPLRFILEHKWCYSGETETCSWCCASTVDIDASRASRSHHLVDDFLFASTGLLVPRAFSLLSSDSSNERPDLTFPPFYHWVSVPSCIRKCPDVFSLVAPSIWKVISSARNPSTECFVEDWEMKYHWD